MASAWSPLELDLKNSSPDWLSQAEQGNHYLDVQALNDGHYLYLFLFSNQRDVKRQLLGAFYQGCDLWFETGDPKVPSSLVSRGLRVTFHRLPGSGYPKSEAEQREYWKAATYEIAELKPGVDPRILIPDSKDLSFKTQMENGLLSYAFKLPLQTDEEHPWSVGAKAGQDLRLHVFCSAISYQAAVSEIVREKQQEVYGLGWSQQGYDYKADGPVRTKAFGLGDYDDWNLDQSIYGTHGIYRHLDWDVPAEILNVEATLHLSTSLSEPQP
jgi:hypothetical protein